MTKIPATLPGTNMGHVMTFVANQAVTPPLTEVAIPTTEPGVSPPGSTEPATSNEQSKSKKKPGPVDYAATFLQPVRGAKPKAVYVPDRVHKALVTITQATNDVGLSDLLVNILNHHFETFGLGIRQFLSTQEQLRKDDLPW